MAHRYATRSSTPTHTLDLTPAVSGTRVRNTRRHTSIPFARTNPSSERIIREERTIEIQDDSVRNAGPTDNANRDKAKTLPCLNNSFDGTPEIITCAICFAAMSASIEPMATRCGHIFCASCLAMSLKKRSYCPTCQTFTKLSYCIRLYF